MGSLNVRGPLPAETLFFLVGRGDYDMVVAMYHDQGHGPIKVLGSRCEHNRRLAGDPYFGRSWTAFDVYARLGDLLNQFIEICRNTAPLALLPVFILLLGIGELSKISMVVYSCAWPLLLNTIAAVKQVDPLLIKSARTMGATPQQLFRKVILPASLPTIFVGIRLASASAMLVLVASEMVGAKAGLGYLIINSQYSFLIPQMYFGILGITVIGLTFNAILQALEQRFMRWKAPSPA